MKIKILKTLAVFLLAGLAFSCDDGKKKKDDSMVDTYLSIVTNPVVFLGLTCRQGMTYLTPINTEFPSQLTSIRVTGQVGTPIHAISFAKNGAPAAVSDCTFGVPTLENNVLASGLKYDTTTGEISGTPTATMATTTLNFHYTMTSKLLFTSSVLAAQVSSFEIFPAGNLTCASVGGGRFGCPRSTAAVVNFATLADCQKAFYAVTEL